jgi:hypothetical protein
MKKLLTFAIVAVLIVPLVLGVTPTAGTGVDITMETWDWEPLVWLHPDSRVVYHNPADGSTELVERTQDYAFEGEQIHWLVLVMEKNGIEKLADVFVTVGPVQGPGNDIESNCNFIGGLPEGIYMEDFNAHFMEEFLDVFDPEIMAIYECILTVESPMSMYGEYWVTVEAVDLDGLSGTFDENEYWFLNPVIALTIDGDIDFGVVLPGSMAYSDTLLVGNDADPGSGVLLDMAVSGTDFYDPSSSGAMCPVSNVLLLPNFDYHATNGAHETQPNYVPRGNDIEAYYNIPYETGDPDNRAPIIEGDGTINLGGVVFWAGNVLSPGSEIAVTFRLALPEPCNGDFSDGSIFFWGTAI